MLSNSQLRALARENLQGKYGFVILATLLLGLIAGGAACVSVGIGEIILGGAVSASLCSLYVGIALGDKSTKIDSAMRGFTQFVRSLIVKLLLTAVNAIVVAVGIGLFFIGSFVGTMVTESVAMLYVVGFVVVLLASLALVWLQIRLGFVFYYVNLYPNMTPSQCFVRSWNLTKGHFWKIVSLNLSFFGWYLLCFVTFGVAIIYVGPYVNAANANLFLMLEYPDGKVPTIDNNGAAVFVSGNSSANDPFAQDDPFFNDNF